jgi:hypothetical protein
MRFVEQRETIGELLSAFEAQYLPFRFSVIVVNAALGGVFAWFLAPLLFPVREDEMFEEVAARIYRNSLRRYAAVEPEPRGGAPESEFSSDGDGNSDSYSSPNNRDDYDDAAEDADSHSHPSNDGVFSDNDIDDHRPPFNQLSPRQISFEDEGDNSPSDNPAGASTHWENWDEPVRCNQEKPSTGEEETGNVEDVTTQHFAVCESGVMDTAACTSG